MKIEIERQDLISALTKCLEATTKNTPHTSFKACRIETDGKEQVRMFTSTDMMLVDTVAPAIVQEAGGVVVSVHSLSEIINAMPKGKIVLKSDETKTSKLSIKSKEHKRNYTLITLDCEIKRPADPANNSWDMSAETLLEAWSIVSASVPSDTVDHRIVPAAQLVVTKEGFSLGGANGRALVKIEYPGKFKHTGTVIVPRKAFHALALLAAEDSKVRVSADDHNVYWESSDTMVATRLVGELSKDGVRAYPPVDPIIANIKQDTEGKPLLPISAVTIVDALAAVAPVLSEQFSGVTLRAQPGVLFVEAESDTGSASEEIAVEFNGEFTVQLSAALAKEVLKPLKNRKVEVALSAENNVLMFKGENFMSLVSIYGNKEQTK